MDSVNNPMARIRWKEAVTMLPTGIILVNLFLVTFAAGYTQQQGRHVCVTQTPRIVNVKTVQTYCKPEYRRVVERCRSGYGMCSTFRVFYRTAYREMYQARQTAQMTYACCPGWTKYSQHDRSCLKPVCASGCHNSGRCVAPDRCQCRGGWMGRDCRTDVDECGSSNHGCMQKCENTIGSYRCSCYEGFDLDYDKRKCKICLHCIKEYQHLKHSHHKLLRKMERIEERKEQLEKNVTNVLISYQFAMENTAKGYTQALREVKEEQREAIEKKIHQLLRSYRLSNKPIGGGILDLPRGRHRGYPAQGPPLPARSYQIDPYIDERLNSLSDQIGILEERLAACNCNSDRRGK